MLTLYDSYLAFCTVQQRLLLKFGLIDPVHLKIQFSKHARANRESRLTRARLLWNVVLSVPSFHELFVLSFKTERGEFAILNSTMLFHQNEKHFSNSENFIPFIQYDLYTEQINLYQIIFYVV